MNVSHALERPQAMNRFHRFLLFTGLSIMASAVSAEMLQVSFVDGVDDVISDQPAGDDQVDLLGLDLVFDNVTGNYQLTFTATAAHPLRGTAQLNANLINGDLPFDPGSGLDIFGDLPPAFFIDNFNDVQLDEAQTSLTLTGTNANLTQWKLGDRIGTDSDAFPDVYPNGVFGEGVLITTIQFESGLDSFPETKTVSVVTAAPVPLPVSLPLFACAAGTLFHRRRRLSQGC